jgi:hypothetical protein
MNIKSGYLVRSEKGMRILKISFAIILLFSSVIAPIATQERSFSLILFESDQGEKGYFRYQFKNGEMISKDPFIIPKALRSRLDHGFDIYRNRYFITSLGDVIDAVSGRIIFEGRGALVSLERDLLFIDKNDGKQFIYYDLSSHRKSWVLKKPSTSCDDAQLSPSWKIAISGCNDGIWFQYPNGRKKHMEGRFSLGGTWSCSDMPKPPVVWADNNNILTRSGNWLVLVDLNNKIERLVEIIIQEDEIPACGPELRIDRNYQIYYTAVNKAWRIDVKKRSFEPYLWEPQGDGFEIEYSRNDTYGHRIRYLGEEIGRFWCGTDAFTAPGYLAFIYGPVGSNLGYNEGVKVWSAANNRWATIKSFDAQIVGWLED